MSKTKKNNINEITLNSIENLKLFHKTLLDEINLVIERSLLTQEKYVLIGSKFKDFAYIIADYYGINFPSLHNILIFLGNKFEIPQNLHIEIIKLSKNISIIKNNKNITVNESQLLSATKLILVYINLIVNKIIQNDFSQQIDSTNNIENNSNNNYNNDSKNSLNNNSAPDTLNNINNLNKFYDFIGLIYISRKKQNIEIEDNNTQTKKEKTEYYLKFKSKSGEEIVIKYNHNWEKLYDYVYSNMKINALKLRYDINLNLYYTSEISLIILEPDLLFDATEIAETYIKSNFVYENYFLSKYKDFKTNQYLVLGNLVNFMLDELVNDIEVEFEDLLKKAFKTKILSYIALYLNYKDKIFEIEVAAKIHYLNLLKIKKSINFKTLFIEPSFISPIYGLQGRLDLLEYDLSDTNKKNIIELKSGKAPDSILINIGNQRFNSIISFTHLVQVTCYNLLLDSTFQNRTGNSYILYSAAENRILRDAINHINIKREVILARNSLVFKERQLIHNSEIFYNELINSNYEKFEFAKDEIRDLQIIFKNFDELQKAYFLDFTKFILKESYSQRIGFESQNSKNSYSSLWLENKVKNDNHLNNSENLAKNTEIIENIIINKEKTDYNQLYIYLEEKDNIEIQSSLRNGDLVTLIPDESNNNQIYNYMILKGYIKDISNKYIIISFRNKQIDEIFLNQFSKWTLYPDFSDATNKRLHRYLFNFIKSRNFKLFVGADNSDLNKNNVTPNYKNTFTNSNIDNILSDYQDILSSTQLNLIKKAILTNTFYLVQGPPGSGKTSYFIKYLTKILFNNTQDTILITSYTNRAVEELCHTLHKIGLENDYLRIGTKATGSFGNFLVEFSNENKIEDTIEKVKKCRIFIATISSLITNPELFEIKKFNIAIIDEASQILESQISVVLSNVDKFVMIGDEKQLPAISVQKPNLPSEILKDKLNFNSLNISYFERMINLFQAKKWDDQYGMLIEQARMHKSIMEYANNIFYDNQLHLSKYKISKYTHLENIKTNNSKTNNSKSKNSKSKNENYLEILFKKRVVLIDTHIDNEKIIDNNNKNTENNVLKNNFTKNNIYEVEIINKLILDLIRFLSNNNDNINKDTFGVISPFRLQNTTIKNKLKNLTNQQQFESIDTYDNINFNDLITVDTVERYQGSEREIILFSSVVQSNSQLEAIQSLKELSSGSIIDRKLNVALTRAKELFIMVGDKNLLLQMESYKQFVKMCEDNNSIINSIDIVSN